MGLKKVSTLAASLAIAAQAGIGVVAATAAGDFNVEAPATSAVNKPLEIKYTNLPTDATCTASVKIAGASALESELEPNEQGEYTLSYTPQSGGLLEVSTDCGVGGKKVSQINVTAAKIVLNIKRDMARGAKYQVNYLGGQADSQVKLSLTGEEIGALEGFITMRLDENGAGKTEFRVPANLKPGSYKLVDASGVAPEIDFKVASPATEPIADTITGNRVKIVGHGFLAGSHLSVSGGVDTVAVDVDEYGDFETLANVSGGSGTRNVVFIDTSDGAKVHEASIRVLPVPAPAPDPDPAPDPGPAPGGNPGVVDPGVVNPGVINPNPNPGAGSDTKPGETASPTEKQKQKQEEERQRIQTISQASSLDDSAGATRVRNSMTLPGSNVSVGRPATPSTTADPKPGDPKPGDQRDSKRDNTSSSNRHEWYSDQDKSSFGIKSLIGPILTIAALIGGAAGGLMFWRKRRDAENDELFDYPESENNDLFDSNDQLEPRRGTDVD